MRPFLASGRRIIYELGGRGNLSGFGGVMKVGIFLTCQHPPGSDKIAALEGQYAMSRLARDRGWDAVATGQHYLSEGVRQIQLVPFLARACRRGRRDDRHCRRIIDDLAQPGRSRRAHCLARRDLAGHFVLGLAWRSPTEPGSVAMRRRRFLISARLNWARRAEIRFTSAIGRRSLRANASQRRTLGSRSPPRPPSIAWAGARALPHCWASIATMMEMKH